MSNYPHLFSPLKVGNLTLRNRLEAAPTSLEHFTENDYVPRGFFEYYEQKAAGGAAIVTVGETPVIYSSGKSQRHMLRLDDPSIEPYLAHMADVIHRHGAYASLEIAHGGAGCNREFIGGRPAVGPSAILNPFSGEAVLPMTEADIEQVVEAFGNGARRLKSCGFDMCMIHAGHGWLIGQFLSPLTNKRTDKFGGTLEGRMRFLNMIIERVRAKAGYDFPIELRMSGTELDPEGLQLKDTVEMCILLDGRVDLFHISNTTIFDGDGMVICSPSPYERRGRNVYLAAEVKKHVRTPVAAIGALVGPEMMEEIIASGKADVVAAARTVIADPYFAKKAMRGKADEIRPCLRCIGCLDDTMLGAQIIRCAVNPAIGRELEYCRPAPAQTLKKILVVGGGPAGMQAAITAAQRGHAVTLCEKEETLGGAIRYAAQVSFKDDLERYRQWLIRTLYQCGAEVRLGEAVDKTYIERFEPDLVICAVGAEGVRPDIPGADGKNVVLATHMHDEGACLGREVVIIGGGLVGCEAALHLVKTGRHPVLLELTDSLLPGVEGALHQYTALELRREKVESHTGVRCTKIDESGVICVDKDGNEQYFRADSVIISIGQKPLEGLRESLRASGFAFVPVGDCHQVGRLKNATASGFAAAMYTD